MGKSYYWSDLKLQTKTLTQFLESTSFKNSLDILLFLSGLILLFGIKGAQVYMQSGIASEFAFSHIINSSAPMDRPFLLEVQCLLERIREGSVLCPNDVDILDRSFTAAPTSEIANTLNDIFALLTNHHISLFFESFSAIQAYARHTHTRIYAQNTLTRRIQVEWRTFDPPLQASLREFVITNMYKALEEEDPQGLLHSYNKALVAILRLEWRELLGVFVANLEVEGLNTSPIKVLHNLTILKMLLSEGFGAPEGIVSSAEAHHFRETLERDMRSILKYLCLCLHDEGTERYQRILRCLETLCHCVGYIPAFELFNCNLIELLVGLIGVQEFKDKLTLCFEEIFRFEDRGTSGSSHSKIAKKLLLILENYLERFERQIGDYNSQEKQCDSTEDSLYSRKTRRKRARAEPIDMHSDLINLLYQFLCRYVPTMDKSKSEGDLDIEFEGSIKLYFSQDLYDAFRLIYWRLTAFLSSAIDKYSPFLEETSDELLEQSRKVVVCLSHLIAMQGKLKLQARKDVQASLIQSAMLNFATLPLQFHQYYLHFKLLHNGCEKAQQPLPFSADLEQDYKELIREILKLKDLSFIFFDVIEHSVSQVTEGFYQKWKESDPTEVPLLQQINTVNRCCWSAVYAYNIDPPATIAHNFTKMQAAMGKAASYQASKKQQDRTARTKELAKCFFINGRYLAQVYMNHTTVSDTILKALLNKDFNDTSLEYTLIVLSKILHYKNLDPHFEIQEIFMMIEQLHHLEGINPNNQNILPLYPAIVRLATVICEVVVKNNVDERKFPLRDILEKLVGFQLQPLSDFSIDNCINDTPQLQKTILLFRKIGSISSFLRTTFTAAQTIRTLSSFFIWTRNMLYNTVTRFQFKTGCFSKYLKQAEREHFDITHLLTFRQHYMQIQRQHAAISAILYSVQTTNHKRNRDLEKIGNIIKAEHAMRQDFIEQKRFKTKEYMSFALEVYRLLMMTGYKDHKEIINDSIFTAMASLDGWEEDSELKKEKYHFWTEITKVHLLRLEKKNKELLVHLLHEFQLPSTQVGHQELIIKTFQNMTETLSEACLRHNQPIIEQFVEIFLATFQKLFSQVCKKEAIFAEVAMLMLRCVQLAASMAPFEARSRKDNLDVLYILLQQHIQSKLKLQFSQEDCMRLHRIFQIRDSGRWRMELHDYVIYLKELNHAHNAMAQ